MKIRLWGVRGSLPTPPTSEAIEEKIRRAIAGLGDVNPRDEEAVARYVADLPLPQRGTIGGNTSCVEIDTGEHLIIIDAGSGIRMLGYSLLSREFGRGEGTAHIFMTHMHWDHIMGFPFFAPLFFPGNRVIVYAAHENPRFYFEHQQTTPYLFPVSLDYFPANKEFVHISDGEVITIGNVTVKHMKLNHPGGSYSYRFDDGDHSFVYASDSEYKKLDEKSLRRFLDFFADADVLLGDTQYSLRESIAKEDWGHSSALILADIATRAGVKKLVTYHHEPRNSDQQVWDLAENARRYLALDPSRPPCEIIVGYEGLVVELGTQPTLTIQESDIGNAVVLELFGHLQQAQMAIITRKLQKVASQKDCSVVFLDLSDLEVLDIAGLKEIIVVSDRVGLLPPVLLSAKPNVKNFLDESGYTTVFTVYPDLKTALLRLMKPNILELQGQVFGARYRLDEMIQVSDWGVIYTAQDIEKGLAVHIYVIFPFLRRPAIARIMGRVQGYSDDQNNYLPRVLARASHERWIYLVQEAVSRTTLRDMIKGQTSGNPTLAPQQAVDYIVDVLAALAHIHDRGLVHGNLYPEQILIGDNADSTVKLTGFLTPLSPRLAGHTWLTRGHIQYLSPEQLRGDPPDITSDLYSVGVILYELLTGQLPFQLEDEDELIFSHQYEYPPHPRGLVAHISRTLEHIVLRLLSKKTQDRYPSAIQVLQVLRNLEVCSDTALHDIPQPRELRAPRNIVGRKRELQQLEKYLKDALAGVGRFVLLGGEAGLGKTALVEILADRAVKQQALVLFGRCEETEIQEPYAPFAAALHDYITNAPADILTEQLEFTAGELVKLVPAVSQVLPSVEANPTLSPDKDRFRLFQNVTDFLHNIARVQPVLFILDRLHLADPLSIELLQHIALYSRETLMLIVGIYNDTTLPDDHPLARLRYTMSNRQHFVEIKLKPLTLEHVQYLLSNLLGRKVPLQITKAIYQITEGNPFFIEELSNTLFGDKELPEAKPGEDVFELSDLGIPQSIQDIIVHRVQNLRPGALSILEHAAVIGRSFSHELLSVITDKPEGELLDYLDEALRWRLIRALVTEDELMFSHALIREVLYERMEPTQKCELHLRIGEYLEMMYPRQLDSRADQLAYHYQQAGDVAKAAHYLSLAARRASEAQDNEKALHYLNDALELVPVSAPELRWELLSEREQIYALIGNRELRLADLTELSDSVSVFKGPKKLVRQLELSNSKTRFYLDTSQFERGITESENSLKLARREFAPITTIIPLTNLGLIHTRLGNYAEALQNLQQAFALCQGENNKKEEAEILNALGVAHYFSGNFSQALAYFNRALSLQEELGELQGKAATSSNIALVQRNQGDYASALSHWQNSLNLFRRFGYRFGEAGVMVNLGEIYTRLGQYDRSEHYYELSSALFHAIGSRYGEASCWCGLGVIYTQQDDYSRAVEYLTQALEVQRDIKNLSGEAFCLHALGRLSLDLDDVAQAQKYLKNACDIRQSISEEGNYLASLAWLGQTYLALGELDAARESIDTVTERIEAGYTSGDYPQHEIWWVRHRVMMVRSALIEGWKALKRAHELLQAQAQSITDEGLRESFLTSVALNREIEEAWERL